MAEAWVRECEALMRSVEQLGKELGALADDARRLAQQEAEARAKALIEFYVPVERRDEAWRIVQHGERIGGKVGEWAAQQGPWGLALKLWPEVKAAVEDEMRRAKGASSPPSAAGSPGA